LNFGGEAVTAPSGPDLADWPVGLFRGFHPIRWLLCLVVLALTVLSAVVAQSLFGREPPNLPGWWQQPIEHLQGLQIEIWGGSLGRAILRGGPLLALNTVLWCLIGGWIARHELVARRRARDYSAKVGGESSAIHFLVGSWKSLSVCCPLVILFSLLLLLPMLFAGWVSTWLGGLGALVVSLLMPVVLVANLALLVIAVGSVAWPLMPIAVAAECGDQFDAISRSYSYLYQCPVRFLLLTAIALGLAGLPLAALYSFAEQLTAWPPEARLTVGWLAAALSASIFWSLQTLVYLHLRLAVDRVDASEVAGGLRPKEVPKTASPQGKAAEVPTAGEGSLAGKRSVVRGTPLLLAGALGSWCLTFWLFTRASRGPAEWLGWGLSDTLFPPAEGLYRVASVIAGLWVVIWLALPLVWAVRRLRRAERRGTKEGRNQIEAQPGRSR
jgi:hypothetical protein